VTGVRSDKDRSVCFSANNNGLSTFQSIESIENKTDSRITVALSSFFFETFNAIYYIKIIKSYRWYK